MQRALRKTLPATWFPAPGIQFNFFNAYDTEMKRIQKKLMTLDKLYAFIHVHTDEKEYNRQGSFI